MTTLRKYLKDQSIRQAEFAELIGVTQATVSRLVSGTASLSLELAVKIERETGGCVPASSWVPARDASVILKNSNLVVGGASQ